MNSVAMNNTNMWSGVRVHWVAENVYYLAGGSQVTQRAEGDGTAAGVETASGAGIKNICI